MQPVENKTFGLRAVTRTTAAPKLSWRIGAAAAVDADFEATQEALARVLASLAPDFQGDSAPEHSGEGYTVSLCVSAMPLPVSTPIRLRRLRAFAPAARARDRDLDVLLISAERVTPEARAAAAMLAQRLGREHLVVTTACSDDPADGDVRDLADVLGSLTAGRERFDALLMPESSARVAAAVIAGLTGASEFATSIAIDRDSVAVTAGTDRPDSLPCTAGLLLALSELLALAGRTHAASQLADAWCRTIEDGFRTADFDVTHPYARLVDDYDFAAAVVERFGQTPRSVRRHFGGLSSVAGNRGGRPAIRLVSSD